MIFNRLFGRSAKPIAAREDRVPAGKRIYAIGDVHGRLDLLDTLIAKIDADDAARTPTETQLILLGDLIDRGPESGGVVDRVMALVEGPRTARCLGGNHEDILLALLDGDTRAVPLFHKVGGRATLLSYGVCEADYDGADPLELIGLARNAVPPAHIAFLEGLQDWVREGDYLFVHAGIRPGIAIEAQSRQDMRWIRQDFTGSSHDHGFRVIHGHTITADVDLHPNRIGIDTGAFASGKLTAVGLEENKMWFLDTLSP